MTFRKLGREIKTVSLLTVSKWAEDRMTLHAAGVAFYTIFSLAPLIIIVVGVSGLLLGEKATEGQLAEALTGIMDPEMAETVQEFVAAANSQRSGLAATIIGFGTLLFAATTVIAQLKDSLNNIWDVRPKASTNTIKRFIMDRVLSLLLVLIFGSFLIASFVLDTIFAFLEPVLDPIIPLNVQFWSLLNTTIFVVIITALFTIIFKMLPDVHIPWRDVILGAFVTTILFLIGRFAIQWYFGGGTIEDTYGAAGSFVIFLIWVYYNVMVVFLGAEFTKVFANRYGHKIEPAHYATFTANHSPEDYIG